MCVRTCPASSPLLCTRISSGAGSGSSHCSSEFIEFVSDYRIIYGTHHTDQPSQLPMMPLIETDRCPGCCRSCQQACLRVVAPSVSQQPSGAWQWFWQLYPVPCSKTPWYLSWPHRRPQPCPCRHWAQKQRPLGDQSMQQPHPSKGSPAGELT
jgi:hypothetical protein